MNARQTPDDWEDPTRGFFYHADPVPIVDLGPFILLRLRGHVNFSVR